MSASRKVLLVNTNADSAAAGKTKHTLRWALEQTQKVEGDYEIVFQRADNKTYTNSFGTGYWTFALRTPLPVIEKSNIKINTSVPKSIVIIPQNAKQNTDGTYSHGTVGNAPLLTIANPYKASQATIPIVTLNEVNFVNNSVNGKNGSSASKGGGGGGGGLGAGAGILLGAGTLNIKNSIFQNLKVSGGKGGSGQVNFTVPVTIIGAGGGAGGPLHGSWEGGAMGARSHGDGGIFGVAPPAAGQSAKAGGRAGGTGNHLSPNYWGTNGGHGGAGGKAGRGGTDAAWNNVHGGTGGSASSTTEIGRGGGGGGGGGGAGSYEYGGNMHQGNSGRGGSGGNAGFGAGGGGGGGMGGLAVQSVGRRATLRWYLGRPSSGGSAGKSGDHAGPAESGYGVGHKFINKNEGFPGGKGGDGASLGGAISILSDNATVNLESVDFIGNTASAGPKASQYATLFSRYKKPGIVKLKDVNFYTSTNDGNPRKNLQGLITSNGIHAHLGQLNDNQSYKPPVHMGTSSIIKENVAKIRNKQIIQNKHGTSDTNIISFEDSGSGKRTSTVTSDFTDPNNPFHQIHRQLVPDQTDTIEQEYQDAVNQSFWDAVNGVAGDMPDIIESTLISRNILKEAEIFDPKIPIATTVLKNAFSHLYTKYNAKSKRDKDMAANNKKQKELFDFLNQNRKAQIGNVTYDIKQQRRSVEIHDFTVGEDIILFPNMTNVENIQVTNISGTSNGYWIKTAQDTNEARGICKIFLSAESAQDMKTATGGAQYINSLIRRPSQINNEDVLETYQKGIHKDTWTMSTRQLLDKQDTRDVLYGPADTIVRIDRATSDGPSVRYKTETRNGDDQVYGSNGDEDITTHGGDDLIMPYRGNDNINAGNGNDIVSYTWLKDKNDQRIAIKVVGTTHDDRGHQTPRMKVTTANQAVTLSSNIDNAESIAAFGESDINLKNIGSPEGGIYSIRTGSGSVVNGSKFNDLMIISYDLDENAGSDSEAPFKKTTKIYGNGGDDDTIRLLIDKLPAGWVLSPLLLDYNKSTRSGAVKIGKLAPSSSNATFDSLHTILEYEGIDVKNVLHQGIGDKKAEGWRRWKLARRTGDLEDWRSYQQFYGRSFSKGFLNDDNLQPSFGFRNLDNRMPAFHFMEKRDQFLSGKLDRYYLDDYDIYDYDEDLGSDETDTIYSGEENDKVYGGDGEDNLYGESGDDFIDGDAGNDTINGGIGDDILHGDNGDDQVVGGEGKDIISGGSGKDIINGNNGNDKLTGGDGQDNLNGGSGQDFLGGNLGVDSLSGGDGDDILSGGDGADILSGDSGDDALYGDNDNDQLSGGDGDDGLSGGDGADILRGNRGDDYLTGGDGADILRGNRGDDYLTGGDGDDILRGNHGDDLINGGDGADILRGNRGDDLIYGGDGDDIIQGDLGNDQLEGAAGEDSFVFGKKPGTDTILDFDVNKDKIILENYGENLDTLTFKNKRTDADESIVGVIRGNDGLRIKLYDVDVESNKFADEWSEFITSDSSSI